MRLQSALMLMVSVLILLSGSLAQAVSFQLFSSGGGDVYRHNVAGSGTPTANGSIAISAGGPSKMTVSPDGELFVSVGSGDVVNRYVDLDSTFIANPVNPTITSSVMANIDGPNGIRFRGSELFVNSVFDDQVVRFNFDGGGAAVANPPHIDTNIIRVSPAATTALGRGIDFSPSGDRMYVSGCCTSTTMIEVFSIDGLGVATLLADIDTSP